MFLKSDLFYFVLVAKAYGFCLRARPVNSDHILNVLETVKFVFCLQIHARAECTMNEKFCTQHAWIESLDITGISKYQVKFE